VSFIVGDTFWIKNPSSKNVRHLYFAIADGTTTGGRILLVNMSKVKEGNDTSCILKVGEHTAVTHESTIKYHEALLANPTDLASGIRMGVITSGDKATPNLVQKIQEGAKKSPFLRQEYKRFIP